MDFSTRATASTRCAYQAWCSRAENLEPGTGHALVGVYSSMTDTTLTSVPFERIARTNQYGHFTIRNLKKPARTTYSLSTTSGIKATTTTGTRSEDIAFYDTMIVPTTEPITVTDTLFARNGEDSLVARQGLRFLPNDILPHVVQCEL